MRERITGPMRGMNAMRRRRGRRGQAMVVMAISLTVLCGMLALGVDMGLVYARHQALQSAAEAAADAGAYAVYGVRTGRKATSDDEVWQVLTKTLANAGFSVKNGPGTAPPNPCDPPRYAMGEVGLAAVYLDMQNDVVTDTTTGSPIAVGSVTGSVPAAAWGIEITALSACQPAAFGAVIGHPRYEIVVSASAGRPLQGPTATPAPATDTPTPAPTATPAATATATPIPSATPTLAPGACPSGWSCGDIGRPP